MSSEKFSVGEEGVGHSCRWTENKKWRRNQQWRVWCEKSGIGEYQKQSGEYWRMCKVEDGHRDKTEQCPGYTYSSECLSCSGNRCRPETYPPALCSLVVHQPT